MDEVAPCFPADSPALPRGPVELPSFASLDGDSDGSDEDGTAALKLQGPLLPPLSSSTLASLCSTPVTASVIPCFPLCSGAEETPRRWELPEGWVVLEHRKHAGGASLPPAPARMVRTSRGLRPLRALPSPPDPALSTYVIVPDDLAV